MRSGALPLGDSRSVVNRFESRRAGLPQSTSSRGRLLSHKALIEEYLAGLTFSESPRLRDLVGAMRRSLLVLSDRLRPVLCMEVARGFGLDPARVLPSAAAIEMVRTISWLREGLPAIANGNSGEKPTAHEEFGEATAILAGDGFFGEALALISAHQKGSPEQVLAVVREIATSSGVGGMVGGQVLRIRRAQPGTDPETRELAHAHRAGTLIEASARAGAILAGAMEREKRAVSEYARQLNACLRLADEVTSGRTGKGCDSALQALKVLRADTSGLEELLRCVRTGEYRRMLGGSG